MFFFGREADLLKGIHESTRSGSVVLNGKWEMGKGCASDAAVVQKGIKMGGWEGRSEKCVFLVWGRGEEGI